MSFENYLQFLAPLFDELEFDEVLLSDALSTLLDFELEFFAFEFELFLAFLFEFLPNIVFTSYTFKATLPCSSRIA